MGEFSCDHNFKLYGRRSRAVWSAETNPRLTMSKQVLERTKRQKRLPPTREQLLAMLARSSWEKKVALCVIILLNRDPAQNEDTREVAVDILQQMGRLLDERQVPNQSPYSDWPPESERSY